MSLIEKLVTPISLQKQFGISKQALKKSRKREKIVLIVAGVLICTLIVTGIVGSIQKQQKTITIGSKDFTEQLILCNLYADVIEDQTDVNVIRKENLGGTQVCYEALKKGDIDMYVDYTGTLYCDLLGHNSVSNMSKVYNTCKSELSSKYNIALLKQCNFNNTYTLSTTKAIAKKYNLKSISDLKNYDSQLKLGCTLEFQNRGDCMPALKKLYNMNFKKVVGIDGSPRYTALKNNEVQVVDAFATDGMLMKYNLVVLKDTDHMFPPYYAVPCIRQSTLNKYPELQKAINSLSPYLTDKVMMKLNYEVDEEGKEPKDVAKEFLQSKGLI